MTTYTKKLADSDTSLVHHIWGGTFNLHWFVCVSLSNGNRVTLVKLCYLMTEPWVI